MALGEQPSVRTPTLAEVDDAVVRLVGGRVASIVRQLRWRPTWFVDVERDGEQLPLVVRGNRVDTEVLPLRHEYAFHTLTERAGFLVPHLHGYADDIDAVIMGRVPGRADFADVTDNDAR